MELQLLKLLLTFDFYSRNKRFVERSFFPKELGSLYDTLLYCHDKYEADLTPSELWEMHKERNPTLTKAAKANLSNIVDNLENEELPKEELATDILLSVWRRERAKEVGEKAIEIFTGGEATFHELREIIQKTIDLDLTKFADNFEEVHEELEELLDDGANYEFEFTLTALHEVLPGLGRGNLGIIFARPEVGKCLGKGTEVLLYSGHTKKVEDVEVGDKLMGPDGLPRIVQALGNGVEDMYKISYPHGDFYKVNSSHILSLKRSKVEPGYNYGDILNVPLQEYLKWPEGRKARYKGWKAGVDSFSSPITVDPYFLGLWLGDGTTVNQSVSNSDVEVEEFIQTYAAEVGGRFVKRAYKGKTPSLCIVGERGRSGQSPMLNLLREAKVIGNKHIPHNYKCSSREDRLLLLAGLLDSDGHLRKDKHTHFEYASKLKVLADDVEFLARSLGFHTTKRYKNYDGGKGHYVVFITGDIHLIPTKIQRKQARKVENKKRKALHFGISVEHEGPGEYFGFTIDGDGLFMLGDFTVTHNTTFAAFLVGEYIRQGHKVAYFGNEEPARRTKLRVISSYLERSAEEIRDNLQDSKDKFNGSGEGLRVFDAVGVTMGEIDNYVESMAPDIVVIDQLDKVRIDGKFQRTDERLKEIYIQARELAKRRNCLVWAISQASADAHDKKYVSFDTMDNSKTGKAGEADLIVGIGKHGGVDEDFLRYLYLSKNKINGRHEIVPCRLDAERARYYD